MKTVVVLLLIADLCDSRAPDPPEICQRQREARSRARQCEGLTMANEEL